MLVIRELGFLNLAYIFFIVSGLIVSFVIRWKWNQAVERKKEIARLVATVSQEAARAELEAAAEYYTSSVSAVLVVPQSHQCAMCYCPTTTRCSRCKAVHYCSGKCQIIHWRLGHKDECYPPNKISQFNGIENDSDHKAVLQGDRDEVCANSMERKESCKAEQVETYIEEPESANSDHSRCRFNGKVGKESDISHGFSTSSSVRYSANTATEPLSDASVRELPISSNPDGLEEALFNDIAAAGLVTKADVDGTKLTRSPPSEDGTFGLSVDSAFHCELNSSLGSSSDLPDGSYVSKLATPNNDFWEGVLDSNKFGNGTLNNYTQSSFSEGGETNLRESKSPLRLSINMSQQDVPRSQSQRAKPKKYLPIDSKKPSCGAPLSEKIVTDASVVKSSPSVRSKKPTSVDDVSSDSQLSGNIGDRPLSSSASCDNTNSSSEGQHISNIKSSMIDPRNKMTTGSSETVSSLWNGGNGLKTPVRKVVQQFKVYKLWKHSSTGSECENPEKYNYKMLFPYDLFVKLYKCSKVELHPFGLVNCGNSCYANAVLQCLAFTRPLTAYLLQGFHSKTCPKREWCFMCEFEVLILKAKEGISPLSPIGILSQLQSAGSHLGHGRHEDAHEFLRLVIDTMQSVCLKEVGETAVGSLADETSLIGLIFGGYLQSKIKCMKCKGKSVRRERMMDLTVEIHGDIRTLEEALTQFTATEILDGENKYECLRCRSYVKAKKKLTILEPPNVLTIALKRFQRGKSGKLNKPVQFQEIVDLAPYMSEASDKSHIYRLYAVVVHLGNMDAAFSGHYVCYVRIIQGKWFMIDDSTVKPVEMELVLSTKAYMLLYARCTPRVPSLIWNTIISNDGKIKDRSRCSESVPSIQSRSISSIAKPSSTVRSAGAHTAQRRPEDYPYKTTLDAPSGFDSFDRRFHPVHSIPRVDSSSDNSSLFSSDEGSCTTESTWDSTSTDDMSDFIFGDAGRNWNSPLRVLDEADRYSSLAATASGFPETSEFPFEDSNRRREGWQDNRSLPISYSNTSIHCRKLTNFRDNNGRSCDGSRYSTEDTDLDRLGWCNPLNVNSGVSQSRSTQERIVQMYY